MWEHERHLSEFSFLKGYKAEEDRTDHRPPRGHRKYVVHSPLFFGEEVVTCKEGEPGWEIYTRSEFGRRDGDEGKGLGGVGGPEETSSKAEVTFVESRASPPLHSFPLPLPLPHCRLSTFRCLFDV